MVARSQPARERSIACPFVRTAAEECRFEGEDGVAIACGDLSATFLPDVGMTGVSLRYRGREHLALPGGPAALRNGHTGGLPLLAPWANRLASRRYRVGRIAVDASRVRLVADDNGLPIHGLLVGAAGWRVDRLVAARNHARLDASIDVDSPAFPFPHRIHVRATARDARLVVDTTIVPTGRRRVPVAFGWHPYLRLPGTPRRNWTLRLPPRATSSSTRAAFRPAIPRVSRAQRTRSAPAPSTTSMRSGVTTRSRSRAPAAAPSSSTAAPATRTHRSGSRRAATSERSSP